MDKEEKKELTCEKKERFICFEYVTKGEGLEQENTRCLHIKKDLTSEEIYQEIEERAVPYPHNAVGLTITDDYFRCDPE